MVFNDKIRLSDSLKFALSRMKANSRETYDSVICRCMFGTTTLEDSR